MPRTYETDSTPWGNGPFRARQHGLTFGQMYEDSLIELCAFKPLSRVFCIAGAGCTARALAAAGHHVTAVDINPRQLAYAEARAAGKPQQLGTVERLMALGRNLATLAGWSRTRLADFLRLSEPAEQLEYWDARLDTRIWRLVVDTVLAPRLLGLCYAAPFVRSLPRDFGPRLRQRLRRGWASHSNSRNPYAAALLSGAPMEEPGARASHIDYVCADAADFLKNSTPATYDAFVLSNIGDGASTAYLHRLSRAVEHAAAPGAVVVTRSFAEPSADSTQNWAALDRSLLWGVVEVSHIGGRQTCSIC
jgi:S-adenosylmethionine:diacylglycerol 3-amino-3-carboxypropyl transferase